jgi:glycine cleavage system H protein
MGEFAAEFPADRSYARNHMWAQRSGDRWRFGFTAYAVRLLQDVFFLDWEFDPPAELVEKQEIGQIESSKAESSLYAPIAGRLVDFNRALLEDPSSINVDKYGAGWLFEMESPGASLFDPPAYIEHLAAVWEVTQKTIKGQLNQ